MFEEDWCGFCLSVKVVEFEFNFMFGVLMWGKFDFFFLIDEVVIE